MKNRRRDDDTADKHPVTILVMTAPFMLALKTIFRVLVENYRRLKFETKASCTMELDQILLRFHQACWKCGNLGKRSSKLNKAKKVQQKTAAVDCSLFCHNDKKCVNHQNEGEFSFLNFGLPVLTLNILPSDVYE